MTAFSAFYPLIGDRVRGEIPLTMNGAILDAAIEFCDQTLCLQRTLVDVSTVANQAEYTLVQSGEVVVKLLGARLNNQPLRLLTDASLDGQAVPSAGAVEAVLLSAPMKVRLTPAPSTAALPLSVRAAMRPSRAATSVADDLFEFYGTAIAEGAIARLLRVADDEDSQATRRIREEAESFFREAIAAAKEKVLKQRARGARRRSSISWV